MSTDTQNNAPVSAEPVAWVRRHPDGALTAEFLEHAVIETVRKNSGAWVPLYRTPVPAQAKQTVHIVFSGESPNLTFVEVEDESGKSINAGQWVKRADGLYELIIEGMDCQTQQLVSGADGLPTESVLIDGAAYELPSAVAAELLRLHLEILEAEQARAALAQQDAALQAEVLGMVRMLEVNEWADHCGESDLGKRLEWAITALQNQLQNIPKNIPGSSQQDADKVDAEPDMFWDADNPEQCQDSIHNLLVEVQCDRTLRVGDIVEIQQAMSLPDISVRVTAVDGEDDDGDLEYEIVNEAAIDAARKEQA